MGFSLGGDGAALGELDGGVVDVNRAERSAHAADVGTGGFAFLLVAAGLVRVHRHRVHPFPVEPLAVARHLVVPDLGGAHALDEIARVGGDAGGDNAFADVFDVGQAQVLSRGDVAEEVGAGGGRDSAADSAGNVVVAGGDVAGQRAEDVEGSAAAYALFEFDVGLDLVERDVAGAFDHDLDAEGAGAFGKFAEDEEFGELAAISGVAGGAGTETVAERDGDVMLAQDGAYFVEMLVERVFVAGPFDPCGEQSAAARDDALDALMAAQFANALARNPAMQGHVIDALTGLAFDHFEEKRGFEIHDRAFGGYMVNRHGAEDDRAAGENLDADLVEVGAGGEIHDGIRAVTDGGIEFLDLFLDELMEVGSADIGVDLGAKFAADADGAEVMMEVMRDNDLAGGDEGANFLGGEAFVLGDFAHLLSDNALARSFKLGHLATSWRTLLTGALGKNLRSAPDVRVSFGRAASSAPSSILSLTGPTVATPSKAAASAGHGRLFIHRIAGDGHEVRTGFPLRRTTDGKAKTAASRSLSAGRR